MRLPWICLSVFLCAATHAQTPTLRLWPGVAPGSEHWAQKEQVEKNTPVGTVIIDVTRRSIEETAAEVMALLTERRRLSPQP